MKNQFKVFLNINFFLVSGNLPPGTCPPIKLPLVKLPWRFPPRGFPPGIFPPMFLNISTRFLFHYCHRYHSYYLKNCFVVLWSKSQIYCGVSKRCSLPVKIVTYPKIFCSSSMIIGHYHIHLLVLKLFILEAEECDVTHFNQFDLNSSFSRLANN